MKEESDVKAKNAMLVYATELIENGQNLSLCPASLPLCRLEEGKGNWLLTKNDRLRRTLAQKVVRSNVST